MYSSKLLFLSDKLSRTVWSHCTVGCSNRTKELIKSFHPYARAIYRLYILNVEFLFPEEESFLNLFITDFKYASISIRNDRVARACGRGGYISIL